MGVIFLPYIYILNKKDMVVQAMFPQVLRECLRFATVETNWAFEKQQHRVFTGELFRAELADLKEWFTRYAYTRTSTMHETWLCVKTKEGGSVSLTLDSRKPTNWCRVDGTVQLNDNGQLA